jgi:tetratricopeptide (TPR) repeat protein
MRKVAPYMVLAVLALGCGGARRPPRQPSAAYGCKPGEGGTARASVLPEPSGEPVTAGEMTEEAKSAKRLFDSEKWAEARMVLARVANGETGDDQGNKQMAEYHLALCDYNLKDYPQALERFARISDDPNHLKFGSLLFWLGRLAREPGTSERAIDLMPRFEAKLIDALDNPQQRTMWEEIVFLKGRAHYRLGDQRQASIWLSRIGKDSPLAPLAEECLGLAKGLPPS